MWRSAAARVAASVGRAQRASFIHRNLLTAVVVLIASPSCCPPLLAIPTNTHSLHFNHHTPTHCDESRVWQQLCAHPNHPCSAFLRQGHPSSFTSYHSHLPPVDLFIVLPSHPSLCFCTFLFLHFFFFVVTNYDVRVWQAHPRNSPKSPPSLSPSPALLNTLLHACGHLSSGIAWVHTLAHTCTHTHTHTHTHTCTHSRPPSLAKTIPPDNNPERTMAGPAKPTAQIADEAAPATMTVGQTLVGSLFLLLLFLHTHITLLRSIVAFSHLRAPCQLAVRVRVCLGGHRALLVGMASGDREV
jgi:hypothetical protein